MPNRSRATLPKNPFMCFLQSYRVERPPGQSQKQLAEQAGDIWRRMSKEEKNPFVEQANLNKRVQVQSSNGGNRSTSGTDEEPQDLAQETLLTQRRSRTTTAAAAATSATTTTTRRACNNAAAAKKNKNMGHRLIECLLCHCENGNSAREALFQFNRKANEYFPSLEDETFYVYYKLLITTLLGIGLFTVVLSLWHFMF